MFTSKPNRPRRGIILLVALGMLALFGILAAAFLTFAANSRQAAFSNARREYRSPQPERLMHEAFMQILRGVNDPSNPLYRHDLLGDYYGYQSNAMGVPNAAIERLGATALPTIMLVTRPEPPTPPAPYRDRGVMHVGAKIVKVPLQFNEVQPNGATQDLIQFPENVFNTGTISSPLALDDALAGRTVSFLEGPLEGVTLKIVRWVGYRADPPPLSSQNHMRYSLFLDFNDPSLPSTVILGDGNLATLESILSGNKYSPACLFYDMSLAAAQAGSRGSDGDEYELVINPIPRNGSGTGIDPTDGSAEDATILVTDAAGNPFSEDLPRAFQPNYSRWASGVTIAGNADEPYDAPDYENFFLSSRQYDTSGSLESVVPSFHRPALVNHMFNAFGYNFSSATSGQIRLTMEAVRRAVVRPLPFHQSHWTGIAENKTFTGGNQSFAFRTPLRINDVNDIPMLNALADALVNGPWDVDNDGDGIPDSIWINTNLPLITAPDGKRLRPLIAVQIEDLSARFNLNAHGNPAQLTSSYLQRYNGPLAGKLQGTDMSTAVSLAAGRGYGPAEIFPLLHTGSIQATGTTNPLYGRFAALSTSNSLFATLDELYASRYASDGGGVEIGTWATPTGSPPAWEYDPATHPGIRQRLPGKPDNDAYDVLLHGTRPSIHTRFSRFGFPLDMFGRGGLGIDAGGNLVSSTAGFPLLVNPTTDPDTYWMDESKNDPYEFDPSGRVNGDSALTLVQMERLMHRNSWTQHLYASRAEELLGDVIDDDATVANLVTTYSSADVRPPSLAIPELRNDGMARLGNVNTAPLVETLLAQVLKEKGTNREITEMDLNLANILLAPEFRLGMPMNVNRHFGNGEDDNSNGVIDEPAETASETSFGGENAVPQLPLGIPYNPSPVSILPRMPIESGRQALARHLYCAAMLVASDDDAIATRWITDTTNLTGDEIEFYRARRIAQWAVNVVDYRDGDSILTRFLYDQRPFNGWNNDAAEMKEVWGCEHPELMFMESLALHDLRVKDTALEADAETIDDGDEHVDQIRMPQGSAFLELFAARPRTTANVPNHEALPSELYGTNAAGDPVLDLDRQVGLDLNGDGDFVDAGEVLPVPVWRIAVSEPHILDGLEAEAERRSPLEQKQVFTDTTAFEPAAPDELGLSNAPGELQLERFVVFTAHADRDAVGPLATTYGVDPSAIFSNITGNATDLPLGTFLNIAPRTDTRLGSLVDAGTPTQPSPRRIEGVVGQGIVYHDPDPAHTPRQFYPTVAASDIQQSLVFLAQAFEPPAPLWDVLTEANRVKMFGAGNRGIGFNISEPLPDANYYRMPEDYLMGDDGDFPLQDSYWDYSTATATDNIKPSDEPYDLDIDYPVGELTATLHGDPATEPTAPYIGTMLNYRTAYLQRLADPTRLYNNDPNSPDYNPYRTVDWITMDLTVFSGDEVDNKIDEDAEYLVTSRQRTGEDAGGAAQSLLFSNRLNDLEAATAVSMPATAGTQPYFNLPVEESLSILNLRFFERGTNTYSRYNATTAAGYTAYIGLPNPDPGLPLTADPTLVLALHPWLNRDYASPMELMWVPATSQGRLFEEFSVASNDIPYEGDTVAKFRAPFGHLLNFFDSAQDDANGSYLYRLFDYLGTGPKFRGSADPFEASITSNDLGISDTDPTERPAREARNYWRGLMAFPFNQFPTSSEQGRINLNTVGDFRVYAGLMWGHLTATQRADFGVDQWDDFVIGRRGYATEGLSLLFDGTNPLPPPYNYSEQLNSQFPTQFAGRLTGSTSADLRPDINGQTPPWIAGTLLRPKADPGSNPPYDFSTPEFVLRPSTDAYQNVNRSAVMRYQSLTRLPNLTTNNSNAYVVRLTLGYFEVDPATGDLGREYLSDYGRNKRYRASYIIDRSIPCLYETGVDHDTEKLILFKRFYEE